MASASINRYLAVTELDADHETTNVGTAKPSVRGRKLYGAHKFQVCEVANKRDLSLFRATTEASSLKSGDVCHPCLAINPTGDIVAVSHCTCQQQSEAKCSHVGGLGYLIEDLRIGVPLRMTKPCTSKSQSWGHGTKTHKNPQSLMLVQSKRFRPNDLADFDPHPQKPSSDNKSHRLDNVPVQRNVTPDVRGIILSTDLWIFM